MKLSGQVGALAVGAVAGAVAAWVALSPPRPAGAASGDRYQDFVMATGAVTLRPGQDTDGVWLLDYKAGKLLGTVIDKSRRQDRRLGRGRSGERVRGGPRQDVHFMMVTGYIARGQAALYVAETATGKFGVYTMGPGPNGQGVSVRRHDLTSFRRAEPAAAPATPPTPTTPAPVVPTGATQPPTTKPGPPKAGG
ncbi:MAG: hypothetical protein U0871_22045 [Gemmataceae bacterium]